MPTMRDGSMEDMANFWIGRVMEKSDWAPANEVYLAIIRMAAKNYVDANPCPQFGPPAVTKLDALLNKILAALPEARADQQEPVTTTGWITPFAIMLSRHSPQSFEQRFAYYWTTNMWKSDFLTSLEDEFWVYRNYAHAAGKGKMAFLRELAEVWIVAAATALVRYADSDPRTWRNAAKLLRSVADMVEADGLRALPWGHWGQYSPSEAKSKVSRGGVDKKEEAISETKKRNDPRT
jgi:hypothetical protein